MNAHDIIRSAAKSNLQIMQRYVDDLSDEDLMRRPHSGCNNLAWQLGHLVSSEVSLLEAIAPGSASELPEGFAEKHSKDKTGENDPAQFYKKEEYLQLMEQVQAASLKALEGFSEADLDKPAPEHFRSFFPTVGAIFLLIANHPLMHAGQFVPVRRELGKPVVI